MPMPSKSVASLRIGLGAKGLREVVSDCQLLVEGRYEQGRRRQCVGVVVVLFASHQSDLTFFFGKQFGVVAFSFGSSTTTKLRLYDKGKSCDKPFSAPHPHTTHPHTHHGAPKHPRGRHLGRRPRHRPPRGVGPRRLAPGARRGVAGDAGVQRVAATGGEGISKDPFNHGS